MARTGLPNAPVHLSVEVSSTNRFICPPLMAFCSGVYLWFWSQVTACAGPSRCGSYLFGLPVSRLDVLRLFGVGVPAAAVNGVPSVLAADGYVPKWCSKDTFSS